MNTLNTRNNRIFIAAVAVFLLFSLSANIYYYTNGRDILAQSTSKESSLVYANEFNNTEQTNVEKITVDTEAVSAEFNRKVEQIGNYLSKRNAPLAKYADVFVEAADYYDIDYRLAAAISVIESNGGKYTFRPYNAWGWGKSGFESWEDGIWTVSKGLAKYYDLGLTTPRLIASSYCPPSADAWASKVSYVMNMISYQ